MPYIQLRWILRKNMVNIERILSAFCILIISVSLAYSQFKDGYYGKLPELDKYLGTWQWESGDCLLTIKLAKTVYNLK